MEAADLKTGEQDHGGCAVSEREWPEVGVGSAHPQNQDKWQNPRDQPERVEAVGTLLAPSNLSVSEARASAEGGDGAAGGWRREGQNSALGGAGREPSMETRIVLSSIRAHGSFET